MADPLRSSIYADERLFLAEAREDYAAGRDINGTMNNTSVLNNKRTRLCFAAERGWCESIRWLVNHGADVGAVDFYPYEGFAPLHLAVSFTHKDAAVLLLDAGARVDARSGFQYTALHLAESTALSKLLLSRGASLDARDKNDRDPETYAREESHMTVALLADVRRAGGWKRYVAEPRAELLALRRDLPLLRERGRAGPSTVRAHERLFLNTSLPDDVFAHVLSFWRSARDY